jgi:hypothetical protein
MNWLQKFAGEIFYHGTQSGEDIRQHGFEVSTSGGGQRGLMGVWLTKDPEYARIYSDMIGRQGTPELLKVTVPPLKLFDFTAIETASNPSENTRSSWMAVGFDVDDYEGMEEVRNKQPYAMTKILQEQGYDGAWIPNTIREGGPPELVIFNPANIHLLAA